jgi:hypothetical protein
MVNLMPDGWKTGTVALEPCGTFGGYPTPPADVVNDAIDWHATLIQNKSNYIPANWLPEIKRLVMKLGFRLVLRELSFNKSTPPGSDIAINMRWENLGIAPPYRDHRIAFRLKSKSGENWAVIITDTSILGWLPGEKKISVTYKVPDTIPPGNYDLEVGVVFHSSIEHIIPIANKGKTNDGWYTVGKINVADL